MRRALPLLLAAALVAPAPAQAGPDPVRTASDRDRSAAEAPDRNIRLRSWDSSEQWRQGSLAGVKVRDGRLVFDEAASTTTYGGRGYDRAQWASPWASPGFAFEELIASWSALTNGDAWIEISVRGKDGGGTTSWDLLARWKSGHLHMERHSGAEQADDGTSVNVDTWVTDGLTSYQLRVALLRRTGTDARPSLDLATAMTSRIPESAGPTSEPGPGVGTVLKVPRFSQMTHDGHYPEWGGGGEAWCSPTSTSMVLGYYDALPDPSRYRWVGGDHVAPFVDHAARSTYDFAYDGTGNWPFNTAYAAPLAGKGFVTRLRSLREAEKLVGAGIPVIASIAFGSGELDGAPIGSSNGHLLVIVGFEDDGDVVVNDPAAASRNGVRRVYRRGQLERIWLEASGGLSYLIHDSAHPLPSPAKHSNW